MPFFTIGGYLYNSYDYELLKKILNNNNKKLNACSVFHNWGNGRKITTINCVLKIEKMYKIFIF